MTERTTPEPASGQAWRAWEAALADAVLALPDGGSVTVLAAAGHARPGRPAASRARWLVGARKRPVLPQARLVRVEDHLRGHWTGALRLGGPFPWTREEEDRILALGWHRPTVGDGDDFVRFWPDDVPQGPYLPREEASRAAAVVAATVREVLGTPEGEEPALPALGHVAG